MQQETAKQEVPVHETPNHRVLSIYNKHILADHLALKRDYEKLCPHTKLEFKFDESEPLSHLQVLAHKRGCDTIIYWETRRRKDLFLYLSVMPSGPTMKFHVMNIKTSKSMRFEGNFAQRTRPLLNFSAEFDSTPEMSIAKELLKRTFSTPNMHFKMAPFLDHLFQFAVLKENMQFEFHAYGFDFNDKVKENDVNVKEAGPYFIMTPVSIQAGCFAGEIIWENEKYLNSKQMRAASREKNEATKRHMKKLKKWEKGRTEREEGVRDEINDLFSGKGFQEAFDEE
ncbi:Ribosome_biogenesis protein Brix [Hexamita inflata]|uniref:Ribosome biogenesis protein Brix n=1 Tax=Hexamita inflata TaxID=28002 RepID=A0AA86TS91_9EUKA|nr:Ribosome biogenesis protein Brix [Hexamita inflata]CAI9966917.1 Ribosome biogenesis protein Brix [Hexamita inflata]